ncbi:hypothetical protein BS50DRAFT_570638 [Corynespora cassiicola Philippines]|uniref:Uncharacterized protein n=1 Tax=Corynespora cassiicola Philippines TaxID=1448308 RepID=A0A2T2P0N8_CORCC|nr:hypothetical protein BS50DRAFT_570638 [Corynespora cassiicola Philippines]
MQPSSSSTGRLPRKWTVAEDQKLREEVEAQMSEGEVKDWCRVANKLPGRTNKDCRKRWFNSVAGGLKKGQWSKSEDLLLAQGVQQFGQRWTLVAGHVGSRSADQCAKRWQQSLDPDLDRSEWRDSDDKILIEAVQRLGRHWKDIQRDHFQGRSKNCIKNRYTVLKRRYQNQGISLPEGAGPSEPSTPDNSQSIADDDSMSYTSSMFDELLPAHNQVPTHDASHSWPLDNETYASWSSQESFNITPTASTYTQVPQQHISASSAPQWNWTATSMPQNPMMNLAPTHGYPSYSAYPSQPVYGTAPTHVAPAADPNSYLAMSMRAPTSTPQSSNAQYQDPRYARYGMQRDPSYHY